MSSTTGETLFDAAAAKIRRRVWATYGVLGLVVVYLVYAWVAFDVTGLIEKAKPERAVLLARDAVAHKAHVTKDLRQGALSVSIEGERLATYDEPPGWVTLQGEGQDATVDLGDGYLVEIEDKSVVFTVPGYGDIFVRVDGREIVTDLPGEAPPWLRATTRKFDASPSRDKRVQVSAARIEVHNYFFGWENFWFAFRSPLAGMSVGEIWDLVLSGDRIQPGMSNAAFVFDQFWRNPEWQHNEVFIALLETLMMAVLGTMVAAGVGLPLAFLAASNFTPAWPVRFAVRRFFDFVRGIDNLIWSLIFIRAFGLGPLTGALAIAVTDTGTLGKLFSEALENIDNRQVEGVRATGASQVQRYRFGVIPQILPVFISQSFYYLESNTRSATVIGALGAGGIGLLLVQAITTQRDWENVTYMIVLVILLVVVMDTLSAWLRRRLIEGT